MLDFLNFHKINQIIERLNTRKRLFLSSIEIVSIASLEDIVAEMKPANPICNQNSKVPTYFNCTVGDNSFKCNSASIGYECDLASNNSFYCHSVFNQCDKDASNHVCNVNEYNNNCSSSLTPTTIFECGSHECKPTQAYPNAGFDCKDGYGCNSDLFNCSGKTFSCKGNDNFSCMGKNNCNKDFDCGNSTSAFTCSGEDSSDSFVCNPDFSCATGKVQCIQGHYTCKSSVTCNTNGQTYTPISPPPSE
jgi:hypothetical protein